MHIDALRVIKGLIHVANTCIYTYFKAIYREVKLSECLLSFQQNYANFMFYIIILI